MDGNIIYKTHTIIRNVAIFVSVIIFYGCSQNRTNLLPSNIITSDSIYFSAANFSPVTEATEPVKSRLFTVP